MGIIKEIWELDRVPTDGAHPYAPYSFVPPGNLSPVNMSITRNWQRKEAVISIPSMDSVLDFAGISPNPMDRRDFTASFRVMCPDDDLDAAFDRFARWVVPGEAKRLIYETDGGALWSTIAYNGKIESSLMAANRGGESYFDLTVTWRIRPDWRTLFSETADVFDPDGSYFAADNSEVFGGRGWTKINGWTSANGWVQTFNIDATGTPGMDMPTIGDTGSQWTFIGPLGGTKGIRIQNGSDIVRNTDGLFVPTYFDFPGKLLSANDSGQCLFDRQFFTISSAGYPVTPIRPYKPPYQKYYIRIVPGIINVFAVIALVSTGTETPLQGGSVTHDWWRKRG